MVSVLLLASAVPLLSGGEALHFQPHTLEKLHRETISGYALGERALVTWGDRLLWRGLPRGKFQVVRGRGRAFAEGGCLLDVNADGRLDIVVNEGPPDRDLVWFQAPAAGGPWLRQSSIAAWWRRT